MKWLRQWQERRRDRCRITEEWCGLFIGRRECHTHWNDPPWWDDGGPCPTVRGAATPGRVTPLGGRRCL